MENTYRYSEKLTGLAKQIFGDIVDKVFVVTWSNSSTEVPKAIERLDDSEGKIHITRPSDHEHGFTLEYDDCNFAVLFTNQRCVYFTASEWASISDVTTELMPLKNTL